MTSILLPTQKTTFCFLTLLFVLLTTVNPLLAQPIGTGNLTTCSANIYDSGGPGGDYNNNENIIETYCSNSPGDCIYINFLMFRTEACCDFLTIYDGPNTSAPIIGTYGGVNSPGTVSSSGGCLTFEWISDGSVQNPGWEASVFCNSCASCTDGILNGLEIGIDCGGPNCPPCPCSALPVANDEACCATPVIVNPDQNCASVSSGTVLNATASFNSNACFGTDDDDVWFSFVATNTTHYVDILNIAGSTTDMYHAVYAGTCSATGTALICNDLNNSVVNGLIPGNTYFIRVYTWTGLPGQNSTFDVCVGTPPPPPANDEPCFATSVDVNPDASCDLTTSGYCVGSTASFFGCLGTADDDVWFQFTAIAQEQNVSILNATGTTDMVHEVFSGTCNALTSIGCSDPNNSSYSGLTIGDSYFVRVYTYSSVGINTSFDICVNSPCGLNPSSPDCNLNYSHASIPYSPDSYFTGNQLTLSDDNYASSFSPLGFDFCFDGVVYQDVMVSSNGYLIFPGCYSTHNGNEVAPSNYSAWSINSPIPNANNAPQNAILGVWQDMNPNSGGTVRTITIGTAPNRVFIAKYASVSMFSCTFNSFSGQVMLYETSNNIEIHLEDKPVCFGWNSGAGIMGLNNFDGTSAVVPTGYNYPNQWSVFNTNPEGHLFECNCDPASCLIILSTELNQFTATRQDKANLIRWQSGSDHELNHFVLEKSTNGYSFFPIQTIEPKGNPSVNDYQYLDEEIAAGTVYYRLRMVDHQNKINYSSIVAINRTFESSQTIVYPNPALNRFNIQSAQASTIEAVVLYDNAGKQFQLPFSVKNNQLVAVEAANVPQGLYTVKIIYASKQTSFKKLTIR